VRGHDQAPPALRVRRPGRSGALVPPAIMVMVAKVSPFRTRFVGAKHIMKYPCASTEKDSQTLPFLPCNRKQYSSLFSWTLKVLFNDLGLPKVEA